MIDSNNSASYGKSFPPEAQPKELHSPTSYVSQEVHLEKPNYTLSPESKFKRILPLLLFRIRDEVHDQPPFFSNPVERGHRNLTSYFAKLL